MREIDLIPGDYRQMREHRRLLFRSMLAAFCAIAVLVLAYGFLRNETRDLDEQAAQLRAKNALTQGQQDELQALFERRSELVRQLSVLQGLRAGAAVSDIFSIVDNALVAEKVWFTDWSFQRAGIVIDGEAHNAEMSSFVDIDGAGRVDASSHLQVETHMSIRGQAVDHSALSMFVRQLYAETGVRDVNVGKTSREAYSGGQIVNFELSVVLTSQAGHR